LCVRHQYTYSMHVVGITLTDPSLDAPLTVDNTPTQSEYVDIMETIGTDFLKLPHQSRSWGHSFLRNKGRGVLFYSALCCNCGDTKHANVQPVGKANKFLTKQQLKTSQYTTPLLQQQVDTYCIQSECIVLVACVVHSKLLVIHCRLPRCLPDDVEPIGLFRRWISACTVCSSVHPHMYQCGVCSCVMYCRDHLQRMKTHLARCKKHHRDNDISREKTLACRWERFVQRGSDSAELEYKHLRARVYNTTHLSLGE
jgi:hypothetical protein